MQDQELHKILLTAIVGFAAGTLTEPLKLLIAERYKKYRVRRLCYEGIFTIRRTMATVLLALEKPEEVFYGKLTGHAFATFIMGTVNLGPLRYAQECESATFYLLDVCLTVTRILNIFEKVKSEPTLEDMKEAARSVILTVDSEVDRKALSGSYLTKISLELNWKSIKEGKIDKELRDADELVTGYREPYANRRPYVFNPSLEIVRLRIESIKRWWKRQTDRGA